MERQIYKYKEFLRCTFIKVIFIDFWLRKEMVLKVKKASNLEIQSKLDTKILFLRNKIFKRFYLLSPFSLSPSSWSSFFLSFAFVRKRSATHYILIGVASQSLIKYVFFGEKKALFFNGQNSVFVIKTGIYVIYKWLYTAAYFRILGFY